MYNTLCMKPIDEFLIKVTEILNLEIYMSRIDEVKNLMSELEGDLDKFYNKGNKAAGTRARKSLQDLKKLAQDIRLEIQAMKNNG
jgi:hypothetical protein